MSNSKVQSSKCKPFSVAWLRSFKGLTHLPEEKAKQVADTLRKLAAIAHDVVKSIPKLPEITPKAKATKG